VVLVVAVGRVSRPRSGAAGRRRIAGRTGWCAQTCWRCRAGREAAGDRQHCCWTDRTSRWATGRPPNSPVGGVASELADAPSCRRCRGTRREPLHRSAHGPQEAVIASRGGVTASRHSQPASDCSRSGTGTTALLRGLVGSDDSWGSASSSTKPSPRRRNSALPVPRYVRSCPQQGVDVGPRGPPGHRQHVALHQPVHARDAIADAGADRGGSADEQRHQHPDGCSAPRRPDGCRSPRSRKKMGARPAGCSARISLGGLLRAGLDQGDHPVDEGSPGLEVIRTRSGRTAPWCAGHRGRSPDSRSPGATPVDRRLVDEGLLRRHHRRRG